MPSDDLRPFTLAEGSAAFSAALMKAVAELLRSLRLRSMAAAFDRRHLMAETTRQQLRQEAQG